jgi:HSP20 family protein
MANITRYNLLDDVFGDLVPGFLLRPQKLMENAQTPEIKMDVSENEKGYVIKADIPGVKKEDIKVDIDSNQVTISAEVKRSAEEKSGRTLRSERYEGTASRMVALPTEVNVETAQAKYDNGVLELTLPKKAGTSSRKLAIQ